MARIDEPLPKAPRIVSPAAAAAIDIYRRAYHAVEPRRRAVLYRRLSHRLTALSARDTASYYRGIQAVRNGAN